MKENPTRFRNSGTGKIVLVLSIIVSGFWWIGKSLSVYNIALVGAIFEFLWLPMLAMLLLLPILSLVFFIKEKPNPRSYYLISVFFVAATILSMAFTKSSHRCQDMKLNRNSEPGYESITCCAFSGFSCLLKKNNHFILSAY
jgi:hypothetical protein